ncbi:MAG: hypothetical protein JSV44_04495, partial [Candidatus Zixiibacteriota bacterium]
FHVVLTQKLSRPVGITLGLYLLALYPFYFVVFKAISSGVSGGGDSSSIAALQGLSVGWIGLGGLVVWGIFALLKTFKAERRSRAGAWPLCAAYSLAPGLLLAVGEIFKGYHAFLGLAVIGTIGLALLLWRQINLMVLVGLGAISLIIIGFWQFVWGAVLGAAVLIIVGIWLKNRDWKVAVGIIMLGVIGFSVHLYIPIRSAHNPAIDENNPSESFAAFVGYLERKQYGNVSMTERIFKRRAEWTSQFGDHRRMGFWGFFKDQYGLTGPRFFIPLILGLFGIWETIRRRPIIGLPLLVITVLCTVGLVLYMNFADGTRQDPVTGQGYLEVRDRDYFFTPGFIIFGMAIGLGLAAVMDLIRETFRAFGRSAERIAFGFSTMLVFMPLFPLTHNYFFNDRSRNFIPYDYAENFLKSCRENAIFITNGDNDTFPIWCIQEVYGVRKDVRVVNLSLANTKWYIKQLRDQLSVPIGFSDSEIERLFPFRTKDGQAFRLQDQLIDDIIITNRWQYPIQLAFTVPTENRRFQGKTLDSNLVLEGMVFTLVPQRDENQMNFDLTNRLYLEEY